MKFEEKPKIEQIGRNRAELLELEKTGKYVFHGSPENLKILEPRQAKDYNKDSGKMENHGSPAVCATPYADVAIFRALINAKDVSGESFSSFGKNDKDLQFSATQNLLDSAKQKIGKVYVLDKSQFGESEGMECRSADTIVPIAIFNVRAEDLPENIKVIK